MSSSSTKQPKHRVSIPAKSALKSQAKGKRPAVAVAEDEPVSTQKRSAQFAKKASKPRKDDFEEQGLSDLSDGAEGEDEFDVEADDMEVDDDENDEGSSDEDGTDEEIEGMKADRKRSKKNTSE